jgi:metal-responsive CopG/Arc/MetJ family transcriptional regulator
MGHSKLSVTIPNEIFDQINEVASKEKIKLSHLVTEALADKLRVIKEQAYIQQVNEIFKDDELAEEQRRMADLIADNTNVEELPW